MSSQFAKTTKNTKLLCVHETLRKTNTRAHVQQKTCKTQQRFAQILFIEMIMIVCSTKNETIRTF